MDESELRNSLISLHSASFAWSMVCCRDRELAEDVLQSVYVKVLDGRAPHAGRSSFRTWLFAVIRNAARDRRRQQWWRHASRLDFDALSQLVATTTSNRSPPEDELAMIRAAIGELPERQRQIAHLVFYEDLTIADAAEVMGISVGSARRHYARAKDALRLSLKSLRPTETR